VPATSLVESRHPVFKYSDGCALHFKMGSLQEFVRHDDVVSDLSPSQFSVHQVHKIVLLDMRLLNTDRNDANILVRKRRSATTGKVEYELIPIDHGYCLPQFLEIAWCDWCWYDWPQLQEPLSAEDRKYILSLSAQDDADTLSKKIPLRRACRRNMIIAGMVVQRGVKANLLLVDIARLMCRDDLDAPSVL
jgi:phosphatidylinositol 4-kinase type 2